MNRKYMLQVGIVVCSCLFLLFSCMIITKTDGSFSIKRILVSKSDGTAGLGCGLACEPIPITYGIRTLGDYTISGTLHVTLRYFFNESSACDSISIF